MQFYFKYQKKIYIIARTLMMPHGEPHYPWGVGGGGLGEVGGGQKTIIDKPVLAWCTPVVPTLREWRQEDQEFRATLSYMVNSRML